MTILGIGVDVLHLPRLTRHLCDNRLARRILSPAELRDYLALPKKDCERRIRFLGVRWAIKEAVYKAVYPVIKPTWHDFTLQRPAGSPKPDLLYHPNDDQLSLRLGRMHASVSHDGDYTFATVIVELPVDPTNTR
ncbi:4'-phosphopantetheinyl transferase [Lactarius akahatsu]|uniref:4'-phosphopantetheinyl transferase n=1 Tax=Lactarius akahatsu TaxID=416441 RepID=A0AAD4QH88_9AGAM|nr:4'-phosphopantetheinyl transferase [Lactarius akahatsu]